MWRVGFDYKPNLFSFLHCSLCCVFLSVYWNVNILRITRYKVSEWVCVCAVRVIYQHHRDRKVQSEQSMRAIHVSTSLRAHDVGLLVICVCARPVCDSYCGHQNIIIYISKWSVNDSAQCAIKHQWNKLQEEREKRSLIWETHVRLNGALYTFQINSIGLMPLHKFANLCFACHYYLTIGLLCLVFSRFYRIHLKR